jgi:hypothetical protein
MRIRAGDQPIEGKCIDEVPRSASVMAQIRPRQIGDRDPPSFSYFFIGMTPGAWPHLLGGCHDAFALRQAVASAMTMAILSSNPGRPDCTAGSPSSWRSSYDCQKGRSPPLLGEVAVGPLLIVDD